MKKHYGICKRQKMIIVFTLIALQFVLFVTGCRTHKPQPSKYGGIPETYRQL
jgi:hypothetical protein